MPLPIPPVKIPCFANCCRYGLPVAFCPNPAAALQVERWEVYFLRERLKTARGIVERYASDKLRRAMPTA